MKLGSTREIYLKIWRTIFIKSVFLWHHIIVVMTTAQLYPLKPELRFCASPSSRRVGVSWWWGYLTMVPAGNKAKRHKNNSSSSSKLLKKKKTHGCFRKWVERRSDQIRYRLVQIFFYTLYNQPRYFEEKRNYFEKVHWNKITLERYHL